MATPGVGKASEVLLPDPLEITANVECELLQGEVDRPGWRVWSYDAVRELWRLASARVFEDVDAAQDFGRDCIGIVVLRADAVPKRCDVASFQAVRQSVNL